MKKQSIGIIGFGRMGKVLCQLLAEDFVIYVYDAKTAQESNNPHIIFTNLMEVCRQEHIFIAVPIRGFLSAIQQISPLIRENSTLIDLCSVKIYPVKIMQEYLPAHCDIIATHPLFGPDSLEAGNLKIMMHSVRNHHKQYAMWKHYFASKHIKVIELTPEEHDSFAARSQGVTHIIGRALKELNIASTPVDTLGFKKLLEIMDQTNHDSWELFYDLLHYNPHASAIIEKLKAVIKNIEKRVKDEYPV